MIKYLIGFSLLFSYFTFPQKYNLPILENLPSTVEEMEEACREYPFLIEWARDGENITSGNQTLLFKGKLPLLKIPHCVLAEKLSGSPLKVLIVSTVQLEGELFYLPSSILNAEWIRIPGLYPEFLKQSPEVINYTLKLLKEGLEKKPDVIILTISAEPFPEGVHKKILSYIENEGKGLILCGVNSYGWQGSWWNKYYKDVYPLEGGYNRQRIGNMSFIKTEDYINFGGIPWEVLPPIGVYKNVKLVNNGKSAWETKDGIPIVGIKEIGKGRIVALGWVGMFPEVGRYAEVIQEAENDASKGISYYERYFTSALVKLILWASKRESPAYVTFKDDELYYNKKNKVDIEIKGNLEKVKNVEIFLWDDEFKNIFKKTIPCKETISIQLPDIPAGTYLIDCFLKDENNSTISWYSKSLNIKNNINLKLEVNKKFFIPGEEAILNGIIEGEKEKVEILLQNEDVEGNVLEEVKVKPDKDRKFIWKFIFKESYSPIQRIKAIVYSDKKMVMKGFVEISNSIHKWDDFYNILWGGWDIPYLTKEYLKIAKEIIGIDAFVAGGFPSSLYPLLSKEIESGLKVYWTNWFYFHPGELEKDYTRTVNMLEKKVPDFHYFVNKYGSLGICVQDERHALQETPPGEEILGMFRKYLKEKYGKIEDLNKLWGTNFTSFDEVKPLSTNDIKKDTINLVGWLEYRIWFSNLTMELDKKLFNEAVNGLIDKNVYYGIEGLFDLTGHLIPYSGFNYSETPFNLLMPYGREVVNLARSFCDGLLSTWRGYSNSKKEYFTAPWWGILHGYRGMGWFCGKTFINELGGLYKQYKWVQESTQPLKEGIGKLIINLKEKKDPVVILYSQPSIYTISILGKWVNPENLHLFLRPFNWSREALQKLLIWNGINYRYISEKQINQGLLKDKKLLILCCAVSISKETCEKIKDWVKDGGVLIADIRPGIFNEIGFPSNLLNEVFGVKNEKFEWGLQPFDYLVWARDTNGDWKMTGWLVGEYFEKSLEVSDGKPLGEIIFQDKKVPCFIYKKYGKGKVLLLNFLLSSYSRFSDQWFTQLGKEIIRFADIKPEIQICNEYKVPIPEHEIVRWEEGDIKYYGIFRDEKCNQPENIYLFFDDERFNYIFGGVDPIEGKTLSPKFLGYGNNIKLSMKNGGVLLVARIPYKIEGLEVKIKNVGKLPQSTKINVEVLSSSKNRSMHVINCQVFNPSGEKISNLSKNYILKDGKGEIDIPFYVNSVSGKWKIKLKEVISGIEKEIQIQLN